MHDTCLSSTMDSSNAQVIARTQMASTHQPRKSTALLFDDPNSSKGRMLNLVIIPSSREVTMLTCFYEEDGSSSTSIEIEGAPTSSLYTEGNEKIDDTSTIFDVFDRGPLHKLCSGRYAILSSERIQYNQDMHLTNECIQYLSHALMDACLFKSPIYNVSFQDIRQVYYVVSHLLMLNHNFFSCRPSIQQYLCPCRREECRSDDVLTALGFQLDWETYNNYCSGIIMNVGKNSRHTKQKTKQLRLCLAVDVQSIPIDNRQTLCREQRDSLSASDTPPHISNHMNGGNIFILSRCMRPLIAITVCPIMGKDSDHTTNVMSNPLLRSCVKRLFVGRTILHSLVEREEEHSSLHHTHFLRTILAVEVPSSPGHDSNKGISLRYRVTSIQSSSNPSSLSNDDNGKLTRYVILPSTRIIFQPSEALDTHSMKQQIIQQYTVNSSIWLSSPTRNSRETKRSPRPYQKTLPPHQHLLDSLNSIVVLNRAASASQSPPTLRSFLFSGPPGVGKTFAVKQAISIANSWFVSTTVSSQQKNSSGPIKLVSLRGSELLASTSSVGGHYAAAARELEKQFRLAAAFCENKMVYKIDTTGSQTLNETSTSTKENETKAVVIFLDECDALVSSLVVAAMLAMLLDLMERGGPDSTGWEKLLVVAATNRVDAIPSFLRRRLEKEVVVSPPNAEERLSLLKGMLQNTIQKENNDDCDDGDIDTADLALEINDEELQGLAETCVGYVAADLSALVRRAAILSTERVFHNTQFGDGINLTTLPSILISDLFNATNDVGASCLRDASISAPPKTTWEDIAGDVGGAKLALRQAIEWPRIRKDAFKALGLSPPRGVLLHGPPGCAKTTLARAAAGSAGVAFLSLSPADVYSSSYVGEAESVVRRAFDLARSASPCVLFFDEIDSIIGGDDGDTSMNGHGMGRGSSAEARVLSTFLNEMDGVDGSVEDGVLVLGATNRPGTLDAALLRPGRFDRVIFVPPPDECGRRDILKMECTKWYHSILNSNVDGTPNIQEDYELDKLFNLRMLAKDEISGLMTGAELVGACREAAVNVMRKTIMSKSCHEAVKMSIGDPNQLMKALKETLETILRETKPLLSDAYVLDEYTRFEEKHQS